MSYKIILSFLSLFILNITHASELEWRNVHFDFTNYARIGVDGGTAIYTLPSHDTLKFKISFVFKNGVFTMPQNNAATLDALADMLILGGFGNKSYEDIQKELTQNGIMLSSSLNSFGQIVITCEALSEDFDRILNILSDLILQPRFDAKALEVWKMQAKSQYINLSNANTMGKQMLFIGVENARLAFGPEHYFANTLKRLSPTYTQKISINNLKTVYSQMLNRNALNVLLSGAYPSNAQNDLTKIIMKIPSKDFPIFTWLPGRLDAQSMHESKSQNAGIKTGLIQKTDMTQSQISLRFYYPYFGELNPIEKAQIALLTDVFSATGGVVGNDRFSKAMRADSGLSYSAHAQFKTDVIYPNTNVSSIIMNFQSPNEKVLEAVILAKKTWDDFIKKGISTHELDRTRSAMMNSMLATELTVFDKAEAFFTKILYGKIPSVNPIQESLESLDKQRNVDNINSFLMKKFSEKNIGTLVIMGNPPKDQIEKLKSLSALDFVEVKEVNSLL